MIDAWDNYPEAQFPAVWEWMAKQFESGNFVISRVAFDEVSRNCRDCTDWLKTLGFKPVEMENSMVQEASRIKNLLGIFNDQFGSGVGEKDLLIIAAAKIKGWEIVTEEGRQLKLPTNIVNMKMPAVCAMQTVDLVSLNFVELIKQSGVVFR